MLFIVTRWPPALSRSGILAASVFGSSSAQLASAGSCELAVERLVGGEAGESFLANEAHPATSGMPKAK